MNDQWLAPFYLAQVGFLVIVLVSHLSQLGRFRLGVERRFERPFWIDALTADCPQCW
jgi:hypothetical protein